MCEILTIKGNSHSVKFRRDDIKKAREANPDGAGYVIFEKQRNGDWEVFDWETFGACAEKWNWESDYYWKYDDLYWKKDKKKDKKKDFAVDRMFAKQQELAINQFMICHFRLSTSGYGLENTQPILKSNYLVIHNGIFNFPSLPKGFSDTKFFTKRLEDTAKKKKIKTEEEEKQAIVKVLEYAGGSYSMFIYSFRFKKLYYVKNDSTTFRTSYDGLLGSTNYNRFPVIFREEVENKLLVV